MIVLEFRTGFGIDIEANEVNCVLVDVADDEVTVLQFCGVIILLPFLKIHIGTFTDLFGGEEEEE